MGSSGSNNNNGQAIAVIAGIGLAALGIYGLVKAVPKIAKVVNEIADELERANTSQAATLAQTNGKKERSTRDSSFGCIFCGASYGSYHSANCPNTPIGE